MAKQTATPAAETKAAATPAPRLCECGCGAEVPAKSRFRTGHDAKLKSRLVDAAFSGDEAARVALGALGWTGFLQAKLERAQAKQDRAATKPGSRAALVAAVVAVLTDPGFKSDSERLSAVADLVGSPLS